MAQKVLILILISCLICGGALAKDPFAMDEAYQLYEQGDYAQALEKYQQLLEKNPGDAEISFNAGASLYKLERYDDAAKYFKQALNSQDIQLREQALYNLGNTLAQQGKLDEAIQSYDEALSLKSDDEDAQFNRDLIVKLREQQKQQQNEQQTSTATNTNSATGTSKDSQKGDTGTSTETGSSTSSDTETGTDTGTSESDDSGTGTQTSTSEGTTTSQGGQESSQTEVATGNADVWIENLDDNAFEAMKHMIKKQLKGKPRQTEKNW